MPIARGKVRSESQRRAQNKYEAKTYKTIGCKLPIEIAEQFAAKAKAEGKTANAILSEMISEYLKK